jgi:hypothetical protein
MTADFDDLVDLTGVSPEDQARLRRVHEMLVAAGPPSELPNDLVRPPATVDGKVVPLAPRRDEKRKRRPIVAVLVAAAVAAACFGGGYLLASQAHDKSAIHVVRVVPMQGQQNSFASLRVGSADASGNWPIELTVTGLKPLPQQARYYLMVWQNGKPAAFCGTFEVNRGRPTTVTFNVAYKITKSTRWVVTELSPGDKFPGHVVMTTS